MNHTEAKGLLSKPLAFGDKQQIAAVRFEEQVAELLAQFRQCERDGEEWDYYDWINDYPEDVLEQASSDWGRRVRKTRR